ncbi:hypothetical protein CHELA40_11105 [Chelatococcus asaccharovorans]|nr:hypothetical protein CHELA40_11105 [Chelatococcus asaccharovorans]CAH1685413.1 hypothetical protein CHELA17_64494 [Chelatococcus asaccharovorans]
MAGWTCPTPGLKALEEENAKLKKPLFDQMQEASAPTELLSKMVGAAGKRDAVAHLRAVMGLSIRLCRARSNLPTEIITAKCAMHLPLHRQGELNASGSVWVNV